MSKLTQVLCDRCGKEITDYDIKISSARIDLWGLGVLRSYPPQRIDLCTECYEKFVNFMERGSNEQR